MSKGVSVLILFCYISTVFCRSAGGHAYQDLSQEHHHHHHQKDIPDTTPSSYSIWNDFSVIYRIYQQCSKDNMTVCLKIKLLTGLEKAFRNSKELKLIEGIKFVKVDEEDKTNEKLLNVMTEKDIEAVLPRSLEGKESTLNTMILKKIVAFIQTHTLQVKFPDSKELEETLVEGRKKKDKKGSGALIMIPLLLGGTFIPIAYGALAMLAGKALIVSKLALVLASIIGIKKLLNGGGHKESQHEVVVSGGHSSGWGRDMDLAYNAYSPKEPIKIL